MVVNADYFCYYNVVTTVTGDDMVYCVQYCDIQLNAWFFLVEM